MFAIHQHQVDALAGTAKDGFVPRLVDYVSNNFPKKYNMMGKARTQSHVRAAMTEAEGYGFITERQIASYIDIGLRAGVRFATEDWARPHLVPTSGTAYVRMRNLQLAAIRSREEAGQ